MISYKKIALCFAASVFYLQNVKAMQQDISKSLQTFLNTYHILMITTQTKFNSHLAHKYSKTAECVRLSLSSQQPLAEITASYCKFKWHASVPNEELEKYAHIIQESLQEKDVTYAKKQALTPHLVA